MRFLQLTGTAELPLPDDRTTAWMISMVCRASETDAFGSPRVSWLGDLVEEGPGLAHPVGDLSSVPTTSG